MSLEKAIQHGKEHRKQYHGSKAFDHSCRNHGSCGYCESNRTIFDKKARMRVDGQVEEWFGYWSMPDTSDADEASYDARLREIGVDPWDFETRRELGI